MRKLDLHLIDSLSISGSIIDFRIYDGTSMMQLIKISSEKTVYGLDTFKGLDEPNGYDLRNPNINEVKKGQYNTSFEGTVNNLKHVITDRCHVIKTDYYNDLEVILPADERYAFALVDLKQFSSTKKVLEYVWDKMSYGGTIFVSNYDENSKHSESVAIADFIFQHKSELNITRQMVVDGGREKFIAIKCYNNKTKPVDWENIFKNLEKVTIALVLKTGGPIYDHNYVNAIAKGLKRNITIDHEIVCLTDNPSGFSSDIDRVIPLCNDFPTWWSKIELFKPGQFTTRKVFYLDLDTIIIDNIDDIVSYNGKFSGLRDFYSLHSLGSGLMAWDTKFTENIYTKFTPISKSVIANYREGDQRWIDENKISIDYLQDMYPNQIVSYKRHCVDNAGNIQIPKGAKIVCFHGNPRPHTITHPAIIPYWQP